MPKSHELAHLKSFSYKRRRIHLNSHSFLIKHHEMSWTKAKGVANIL